MRKAICFESDVAEELKSADQAIMLHNLYFWVDLNRKNESELHYKDGRYWTFNSLKAIAGMFPWWSEKQVRTLLQKLKDSGFITTGCFNAVAYDRKLWYTLTDKGMALMEKTNCLNGNSHLPFWANVNDLEGRPITDNNTDNKTDTNKAADAHTKYPTRRKPFVPPSLEEVQAYVKEKKLNLDAKRFFDYFEAGDWKDSKGKKVISWKQKAIMWSNHTQGNAVVNKTPDNSWSVEQHGSSQEFLDSIRKQCEVNTNGG